VRHGERVVLIDDLIATGGTMLAGLRLLQRLREAGLPLFTLLDFEGQ
jgi:adenine phosphoribosyltransferase